MRRKRFLRRFPKLFTLWILMAVLIVQTNLSVMDTPDAAAQSAAPAPYDPLNRPYTADSYWNTPIAADRMVDSRSEQLVNTLGSTVSEGKFSLDTSRFTFTVYYADASTPRHTVNCVLWRCSVLRYTDTETKYRLVMDNVPIPDNATPSPGDDLMIVLDTTNGYEYGFYHPRRRADGTWESDTGYTYSVHYNGIPPKFGSRAAGLPYMGGLIRPHEIRAGRIDHVLAFGYPNVNRNECVWPSNKLDDGRRGGNGIPLGAHLRLDPTLTEADFDAWGLNRPGKIIARALQEYGMVLVDYSGAPKIYMEDLINNPNSTQQWSDPDLNVRTWTLSPIPFTEFQVMDLPDAYWDKNAPAAFNGMCYLYP